jgi:23S rRNA (guanine1835-N2)-methyltransferase
MQFNNKTWKLERYPKTTNNSLKAWNAADELILSTATELGFKNKEITIVHDSFGVMATVLSEYSPTSVITYQSQLKSTRLNLKINKLNSKDLKWSNPFKTDGTSDLILLKIPKSADLFDLYLSKLHQTTRENSIALCGFMTKYFTPKWLEIAKKYFEVVEQSKAAKKARLLILKSPKKEVVAAELFHLVKNNLNLELKQYSGVFSASKVDIATQVLLDHLPLIKQEHHVLDLACGNGVIGAYVNQQKPDVNLHLLDDNFLAISSAKLNLTREQATFHWADTINACKDQKFDIILCNPPFHFEYENNIEVSLKLFREASAYLKEGGEFRLVANTHLNYRSHLNHLFKKVKQVVKSGKYEVISCIA